MALRDPEKDFIRVNKILGKQASIGFIPANQILPWCFLTAIAYTLTMGLFSLGLGWFFTVSLWLIVSWWLLTGNQPHLFTDKFRKPPGDEWCSGDSFYISPISSLRPPSIQGKPYDSQICIKLKPKIVPNQYGGRSKFMPFQNEINLCCLVEIEKDGRQVSGMLLNNGTSYQLVFGFRLRGLHNLLCLQQQTDRGTRQVWEQIAFCTWTAPKAKRISFLLWGVIALTNQTSVNPFPDAKLGGLFVCRVMDNDELQIVADSCSNVKSEI